MLIEAEKPAFSSNPVSLKLPTAQAANKVKQWNLASADDDEILDENSLLKEEDFQRPSASDLKSKISVEALKPAAFRRLRRARRRRKEEACVQELHLRPGPAGGTRQGRTSAGEVFVRKRTLYALFGHYVTAVFSVLSAMLSAVRPARTLVSHRSSRARPSS